MILPSPPAAVGVFEGAALIALKAYGVPYSSALPYALVLHLVNFVPFVVARAADAALQLAPSVHATG